MMHVYRVGDDVFRTGFAREGEYEAIPMTQPPTGNKGERHRRSAQKTPEHVY